MKVLITGASGFSAHYLAKLIALDAKCEIYLSDRVGDGARNILACDLIQKESVEALIGKIRPERIYQLAGSFTNNYEIDYSVNVLSTKNILDALLKLAMPCRVLLVGSSAEYGFIHAGDNPVNENQPLRPCRIHGLTKVYQTYLMNFYCRVFQMDIVMARTFNLYGDSKRISRLTFVGKVCEQIEKFKRGEITKIVVGNLETKRDYLDIRDAVKYYQKIMECGKANEAYNVGSGICVKMRDFLGVILNEAGLDIKIVQEVAPLVPDKTDIPDICADLKKIKKL